MTHKFDYDLVVIGAGPAGYVAAIRASQLGLKTIVVERDKPGGVCLNVGCIPSKALIHQAEIFRSAGELSEMGIGVDMSGFDYTKVFEKSRKAAQDLARGVDFLLKKNKVVLEYGEARITGAHEVVLNNGKRLTANYILIATGSRPREIPGFTIDEETVLSSTGAIMLEKLPQDMVILGGGAIGIEFAHIMNAFGVNVHVVEMMDSILPIEDAETVEVLEKSLKKRGIKISTATRALSMEKGNGRVLVSLEDKEGKRSTVETEKILVAVGRVPNTENIGLENIGITTQRGFIPVGEYYQTQVPGVFAAGDVVDSPLLAHVASKEGEIAVQYMAGIPVEAAIDPMSIPGAVYCEPQIASFGYTEKKAKAEGLPFKKAVFPYRGAGKSVAIGRPEGLVKIVYHKETGEILGGHVVGADATEIIHELLLAKTGELLTEDVSRMIHAHPTLSEAVMEAARAAEGYAVHA